MDKHKKDAFIQEKERRKKTGYILRKKEAIIVRSFYFE
jgi:hypothetical protein